ncbi:MAG: bile acid:sodium symporter family protein, partial [Smithellaceae bacterium]|nr:bile acid:sodium symporter family protein [Smithellaceae bacterium]
MDAAAIDQIRLNFNPQGLFVINMAIGLMMLGVALEMKVDDFRRIFSDPKAPVIGLVAQFILFPAFTYLLVLILKPAPSIALGMMLVAACPGGNLSNILTYLARGNTAISVTMTAFSTVAAIVMTPLNLSFWGGLNPGTSAILRAVSLSPIDVFTTVFLILGIPLIIGMAVGYKYPRLAERVRRPFKLFALVFFLLIVGGALAANWQNFLAYVGIVIFGVFVHNLLALSIGYFSAWAMGVPVRDRRAITIEVGIQNSALALILIFTFFEGLGG